MEAVAGPRLELVVKIDIRTVGYLQSTLSAMEIHVETIFCEEDNNHKLREPDMVTLCGWVYVQIERS